MFLGFFEKWQIKSIFMLKQKSTGQGEGVAGAVFTEPDCPNATLVIFAKVKADTLQESCLLASRDFFCALLRNIKPCWGHAHKAFKIFIELL